MVKKKTQSEGQYIIALTVKDIMRIKLAAVKPKGRGLVMIGGKNEAGKTSLIDSIPMVLGGKKYIPPKPVRRGAKKGEIRLELPDFIVTRTLRKSGATEVVVTGKGGQPYGSPQRLLDDMKGKLTFDPLAFSSMKSEAQLATLIDLDPALKERLEEIENEKQAVYVQRTEINRDVKELQAAVDLATTEPAFALFDTLPDDPVSAESITSEIREAEKHNQARAKRIQDINRNASVVESAVVEINEMRGKIVTLQARIVILEDKCEAMRAESATLAEDVPATINTADLTTQFDTISDTNEAIGSRQRYHVRCDQLAEAREKSGAMTTRLDELAEAKATRIAEADLPVADLGFDENGVTLKGQPFEQASQAERIAVSVAMGIALNPMLRILLIRDGSLLDNEHLKLIAEMAEAADMQVWIEWVTRSEADEARCAIVFEEGEIK